MEIELLYYETIYYNTLYCVNDIGIVNATCPRKFKKTFGGMLLLIEYSMWFL